MKKIAVLLCFVMLLCSIPMCVMAAEPQDAVVDILPETPAKSNRTVRVLLIGNSYLRYNKFSKMFTNLCRSAGKKLYIREVTKGKHALFQAANPYDLEGSRIRHLLTNQKWDYVVLQDRHAMPISHPKRMSRAVQNLSPYIKASGAELVLFMTWAPMKGHKDYQRFARRVSGRASYQAQVSDVYHRIAYENDGITAPVGNAFLACQNTFPNISLIRKDRSHPTAAGSYLAASVLYATIFEESPVGLSYKGKLGAAKARKLQRIAARTTNTAYAEEDIPVPAM